MIRRREFEVLRLQCEDYAEFEYMPTVCKKPYRMIALRKNNLARKGRVCDCSMRFATFSTLRMTGAADAEDVVFEANDRCNQENLIAQLAGGVRALSAPVDNLTSNWAYMVMTALAWNLKSWWALRLPEDGRWREGASNAENRRCCGWSSRLS